MHYSIISVTVLYGRPSMTIDAILGNIVPGNFVKNIKVDRKKLIFPFRVTTKFLQAVASPDPFSGLHMCLIGQFKE